MVKERVAVIDAICWWDSQQIIRVDSEGCTDKGYCLSL